MRKNATFAPCFTRRDSFTIFELLVVVVIVLFTSLLLASATVVVRQKGSRIQCMSNQRQILMAFMLYSADNDGYLPIQAQTNAFWQDWSSRLTNYLSGTWAGGGTGPRSVFTCPDDQNARTTAGLYGIKQYWRSYAVNGESGWWTNSWIDTYQIPWPDRVGTPHRLARVPLHVVLIGENHGIDGATPAGVSGAYVEVSEMEGLQGYASAMHRDVGPTSFASTQNKNGGGNYGFGDGRVEFHYAGEYDNDAHAAEFQGGPNDPWKWL